MIARRAGRMLATMTAPASMAKARENAPENAPENALSPSTALGADAGLLRATLLA